MILPTLNTDLPMQMKHLAWEADLQEHWTSCVLCWKQTPMAHSHRLARLELLH